MSTAIAVRPDDLDSLAVLYGSTALDIRATSGQASVPLPLVQRDPAVRGAGLEDRLGRLSAILRNAAAEVESHERALVVFAGEVRAIDAGAVVLGGLAAAPSALTKVLHHTAADAWKLGAAVEHRLFSTVQSGIRSEFGAVRKVVDGVGRTIAAGANDLHKEALALQRVVDSGAARVALEASDRWNDLTGDAERAWHALGSLAGTVERWVAQLAHFVAEAWHTARDQIDALLKQIPGGAWGALGLGAVGLVAGPGGVALVLTAIAVDWVATHIQPLADKAKQYGGKLETSQPDPKAEPNADSAYELKVDVPLPWGHVGGSVALKTTNYTDHSEDVTLNEEIFAGVGLDALKRAGLDLDVTESLQAGQTWHFRNPTDAKKFIARLGLLAVIAELANTSPLLAAAAVTALQHTDPNLLRIPPPSSVSVREGIDATASVGIPDVAKTSATAGLGQTVTVDNTGHASYQLDASFGLDASLANPLSQQGVHVSDTATGSVKIEPADQPGLVKVTLEGDLAYEAGHLDGVVGTGLEQSSTGRLHLSKTVYLPADQVPHLVTDGAARAALLRSNLNANDASVEVWAGTKSTVHIADDLVTASAAGEHRVASMTGRDLADSSAKVFATASGPGGAQ